MKDGKLVLALDFDGTICEHEFPGIGEMKPDAKEVIQALDKAGCKIIIHTCRTNINLGNTPEEGKKYVQEMIDWLKKNEIPYDEIWDGVGKPFCHLFIDDHAIPFVGWAPALDMILKLIEHSKKVNVAIPESK